MHYSRRSLLKTGVALAAVGSAPRPLRALVHAPAPDLPPIEDPRYKTLSTTALDAARSAGASYADARLTHSFIIKLGGIPAEGEAMTFGLRVLVGGYWGFAASPVWTADEAARLGRAAVRQAKANMLGKQRDTQLAPVQVTSGHWTMPVRDDVFLMSPAEIEDYFGAIDRFLNRIPGVTSQAPSAEFVKQERAFASSDGQFCTQRLYRSSASFAWRVAVGDRYKMVGLDTTTPAGAGFEYIRDQPIRAQILQAVEEAREDLTLPVKPIDVGRYELLLDPMSVANALSQSIGTATELDRALGFESNAGGTSYITEPLEMVGSLKIGAPMVTVSGNRSEPGGVATVKWDDEGVRPEEFTLVNEGILADMQTTREGGMWLKPVYDKRAQRVASRGCAFAPQGINPPLTHCANLRLHPGSNGETLETMIGGVRKGIMFKRGGVDMDFQQTTGFAFGDAFEVKDGKRVAALAGAGCIFRTPELWTNTMVVGGARSQQRFGLQAWKGQPTQVAHRSVTVPPMLFKDMTVIDISRKA